MTMARRLKPPTAFEIVKAFSQRWDDIGVFIDWGEPACFACGYRQARWLEAAPWDESLDGVIPERVLNERWERSRLQKAHLVAIQFGGSNEPDNYALLCPRCHRDAPDVPMADVMARWITRRGSFAALVATEFFAACPPELMAQWRSAGEPMPDVAGVVNRGGVHFDPDVGPYLSFATLAAVAVEAVELSVSSPGQLRLL